MITVNFTGAGTVRSDALYQYDINQTLAIVGSGLTVPPVIHFVSKKPKLATIDEALVVETTISSGVVKCEIPNILLTEPYDILAFVYTLESNVGTTVEMIRIPVIDRPKPKDYEYSDNISIITAGKLSADIVTYYNKAIAQLTSVQTALETKISTEKSERTATDTDLQSQINAIVISSTAKGDAAAEVGQARVDPNGTQYANLKARLDALGLFVGSDGAIYQME